MCGAAVAGLGGQTTGDLVESDQTKLLIDCGPGSRALLPPHVSAGGISGVPISHMHYDNWFDLLPLALACFVAELDYLVGRNRSPTPLPVYLPPVGKTARVSRLRCSWATSVC